MRALVKICGVRRVDDARLACELGAAAIGFVFWPGSPRFVDPELARAIVSELPPFVSAVGVFVDQTPEYVSDVTALVGLAAVQLHGEEPPGPYMRGRHRVIKAVPVGPDFDPAQACAALAAGATMLLDAHDPIRRGGTGRTINWRSAAAAARLRPVILSGGLTPRNVVQALLRVRPYAVDVSSGVESAPGVKDPAKLRELFAVLDSTDETGSWTSSAEP
jgi:phosphoribosylanthranilate isomerase